MVPRPSILGQASLGVRECPRLPPLKNLRVKRTNKSTVHPCLALMNSVLACWASAGPSSKGCVPLESKLTECMDTRRTKAIQRTNINYHLQRFRSRILGPSKNQ